MKAMLIQLIAVLVRKLVEPNTWANVRDLVIEAEEIFSSDTPGAKKREWVIERLGGAATWAVNLALETIVAMHKV